MPAVLKANPHYRQLIEDGYCIFKHLLDEAMIERLMRVTVRMLTGQSQEHFREHVTTGSMIDVAEDPGMAELIAYRKALHALHSMGFEHPRFQSGYVISKPPHSPPLFWHQDWTGWNSPCSYRDEPHQVFLMYYLVDTGPDNGCLRVIPGSHRRAHRLHALLGEAHTATLSQRMDEQNPAFAVYDEEMAIPVKAGDLVVGDSRLLHSAYGNNSDRRRTLITLWYHPLYDLMPEEVKAYVIQRKSRIDAWPAEARDLVMPIEMDYEGSAPPIGYNRNPDVNRMMEWPSPGHRQKETSTCDRD